MTESSSGQWKPRFPVARIKKIMQADEDVGKVAQVTPVAISKALELFMDRIIKAVADETKARGARRVTPSHFKQIISTQKQYDFLESLTSEIPLPPSRPNTPPPSAPRRRRKQSPSTNDNGAASADPAPQKRKRRSPKEQDTEESQYSTQEPSQIATGEIKVEPHVKDEMEDVKPEPSTSSTAPAVSEIEEKKSRGWFDIVMGDSIDHDSSEDEAPRKRRVKDEDSDYVP